MLYVCVKRKQKKEGKGIGFLVMEKDLWPTLDTHEYHRLSGKGGAGLCIIVPLNSV